IIIATATVAANGTSVFSAQAPIAEPFVVTTTVDNGDNLNPTPGSLRANIINLNTLGGASPTKITFQLSGNTPFVITPPVPLPPSTKPVILDGTTQSGIQIAGAGLSGDGLILGPGSDNSTIQGLDIYGFNGAGIRIRSSTNKILQNFVGLLATDVT